MPTIKDLAREAGVSQGTVSNVLNGKENVSAEKIIAVQNAAAKLGYTTNVGARLLRRGNSNTLGVILPNIIHQNYLDFYLSFKHYAQTTSYTVNLYLTDYNSRTEQETIYTARSETCAGLATFSHLAQEQSESYKASGYSGNNIVYLEQKPSQKGNYIGFDYGLAGESMARVALQNGYQRVAIITNDLKLSSQRDFLRGFDRVAEHSALCVTHQVTDKLHCYNNFLNLLENTPGLEAVFISSFGNAIAFRRVAETFYNHRSISAFSLSPLFTVPGTGFKNYELNYRLMGKTAAELLISSLTEACARPREIMMENDGFRCWHAPAILGAAGTKLRVLTLNSPTAKIIESVAGLFTTDTGVQVEIVVQSYDEIHQTLSELKEGSSYDVIRLDHTWLSYFAKSIFTPLESLDSDIARQYEQFLPNIKHKFSVIDEKIYCMPETPSALMLFYRKDLFENTALKRLYKEKYHRELRPPENFEEYNRIARFFTHQYNPYSPVSYGTTLTLGNTGVAATEFLMRYACLTDNFFEDDSYAFRTGEDAVQAMSQLVTAKKYSPPQYSEWWRDTAREFAAGDIAMALLFSNFASEILNPDSQIAGKVGYCAVPGGNPLLGGGSIGVSRYSHHKEAALAFIKWICSEEIATFTTLLGSVSPCKRTYENYEVVDTYPWLPLSIENISSSTVSRVPKNFKGKFDERGFLNILGEAVTDCCTNRASIQEALKLVSEKYSTVLQYDNVTIGV